MWTPCDQYQSEVKVSSSIVGAPTLSRAKSRSWDRTLSQRIVAGKSKARRTMTLVEVEQQGGEGGRLGGKGWVCGTPQTSHDLVGGDVLLGHPPACIAQTILLR